MSDDDKKFVIKELLKHLSNYKRDDITAQTVMESDLSLVLDKSPTLLNSIKTAKTKEQKKRLYVDVLRQINITNDTEEVQSNISPKRNTG